MEGRVMGRGRAGPPAPVWRPAAAAGWGRLPGGAARVGSFASPICPVSEFILDLHIVNFVETNYHVCNSIVIVVIT